MVEQDRPEANRPKIVFLVTEDWFFYSHFMPFLREARRLGLEAVLVTRVRNHGKLIADAGCRIIPIEAERTSFSLLSMYGEIRDLQQILQHEQPDIVHCVALRFVLSGGLAAQHAKARNIVLAPVGLGHLWISNSRKVRVIRSLVRRIIGQRLRRPGTTYLFENEEDPLEFGLKPQDPDVAIIGGSGVDPREFYPMTEPTSGTIKVAVVARMTKEKGIRESIIAAKLARDAGAPIELHLFGDVDPSNRATLTKDELESLCREFGAQWHGHSTNVPLIWRDHHVAMLLSQREGLPRSLIEAAACGRAILTTDVPGCRSVVRHENEGLLVAKGDVNAAALALRRLASDAELRQRLGEGAARRFKSDFTFAAVETKIASIYSRCLA